jgi:hypothetical protein
VEAWNCFFGAEHRAAVVMARSALRRALWDLDEFRATPEEEVRNLVARGLVADDLAEHLATSELTHEGRTEDLGPIDESAAERAVTLLDEFLEATIAPPAR